MDAKAAQSYMIDPLTAPQPSEETGPGSHFRSTFAPTIPATPRSGTPTTLGSKNPFQNSSETGRSRRSSDLTRKPVATSPLPSPPTSGTVAPKNSPYRKVEAFAAEKAERRSGEHHHAHSHTRSRGSSMNLTPLESAKLQEKLAHRSPHLKKKHIPGTDTVDKLDVGPAGKYHHEGPYDAALFSRNTALNTSPLAAVADSNREALRATPQENIRDSLDKHKPLDGVASVPPGSEDRFGRRYDYKEGDNMETSFGGDYKRIPGVVYHPDDIKGKGEPSYSIEKALKEHKIRGADVDDKDGIDRSRADAQTSGIEMQRRRGHETFDAKQAGGSYYADDDDVASHEADASVGDGISPSSHKRHSSGLDGLKKRIVSLRKRMD